MVQSRPLIPVGWFVDEEHFKNEQFTLFKDDIPHYLGHASAVKERGDYYVLPTSNDGLVLVNDGTSPIVFANICRHRQAVLLRGKGNRKAIVCPVHYWKYDLGGNLSTCHGMDLTRCHNLKQEEHIEWNGLLFKKSPGTQSILDRINCLPQLHDRQYVFGSSETLMADYNWKIFMETYLDLYHISAIHPGLRKFANCDQLEWHIDEDFSSQKVGTHMLEGVQNQSPNYTRFSELLAQVKGYENHLSITWFCLYPNIMIEIYPLHMVVSIAIPVAHNQTKNVVEFFYDKILDDYPFGAELHQAFKDSYLETALEDDDACLRMQEGREYLFRQRLEDFGPTHPTLEAGLPSFHEYWNRHVLGSQRPIKAKAPSLHGNPILRS